MGWAERVITRNKKKITEYLDTGVHQVYIV